MPSITGKMELEYEGELKGAEVIARELIRTSIGRVFSKYFGEVSFQPTVQWFETGGELKLPELIDTGHRYQELAKVQGLFDNVAKLGVTSRKDEARAAAAAEMILEGLWAHRRIGRSEERGFYAEKQRPPEPRETVSRPRRNYN
jgi:magnesium chelatase subunit I